MKTFTLLGVLLCVLCTAQAKERVIERPPFLAWSSSNIEIDKIVISDTETTMHFKAFHQPKSWIKIAKGSFLKDNNGQLYPIRNGIGITLDQEFWMPESGKAEFQLVFPPIPQSVTSVDFSEGDIDGAYKIWEIQLSEKEAAKLKAPKEAITYKVDRDATLQEPEVRFGKGTLKGKILNYKEEILNSFTLYISHPVTGMKESDPISVNPDGTFQTTIDIIAPTTIIALLPFAPIQCLMAPGEETNITINTWECTRQKSQLRKDSKSYGLPVYFSGYMARQQQELFNSELRKSSNKITSLLPEIDNKSPEEVKAILLRDRESKLAKIEQAHLSEDTKEILRMNTELTTVQRIVNIQSIMNRAYVEKHKPTREQMDEYYKNKQMEIPDGFYDTLKDFTIINTPQALYSQEYLQSIYALGRHQDLLKKLWGMEQSTFFAMLKTNQLGSGIAEFAPLTAAQKDEIATLPSPAYGQLLNQMNDDLLEKIELNKRKTGFTINEAEKVANEKLFSSIISKFHGHTLLVDFWATWCGPCRIANKDMIPMKEELKDKDIIFLYITGETSPLGTWQNMIPDIHGEHFRVTKEQWSYLMSSFKIEGVPTYLIIDKEGNTTFRETGFPGVNTMKEQLLKALEK